MSTTFVDHTTESAPPAARAALAGAAKKFGLIPSPLARLATSPTAIAAFTDALAHFDRSSLDPLQREVVALTVATRNGCHYCVALHSRLLAGTEADPLVIDALRGTRPLPEPRLEALRRFTVAVLERTGDVSDADRDAFFAAGHDARQALDVVVGIAAYTLSTLANRLTRAPLDSFLEGDRWTPSARR